MIIFYDGNAALCVREMNLYKKYDVNGALECRNIRGELSELASRGITLRQAEKQLYVITNDGILIEGVDALLSILAALPKLATFSEAFAMPGMKQFLGLYYKLYIRCRS